MNYASGKLSIVAHRAILIVILLSMIGTFPFYTTQAQIPIKDTFSPANVAPGSQCGMNADARIVLMIDVTSSITSQDLTNEKNGARTLLNYFSHATIKPEIAIGTFNVSADRARLATGGGLTSTYGSDGIPASGLYAAINGITTSQGETDLASSLNFAQGVLASAVGPQKPSYIILISDGIPNRVPGDAGSCRTLGGCCGYQTAYSAASAAAAVAKNSAIATKIITVRYGTGDNCPGETAKGAAFLQANIASNQSYHFEGNADLNEVFILVSDEIVCDDDDDCTADSCDLTTNICSYVDIGPDSDGDGINDCNDVCVEDPNKAIPGACGCGLADTDSDNDGTSDCLDDCSSDATKTAPGLCGCGILDADTDQDSIPDCHDRCPNDSTKTTPGICGCGVADLDSDGDITPDCQDQCPQDPVKASPGNCGCGVADTDSDSDGTANCHDQCPSDQNKTMADLCGCGVPDTDSDGDGSPDCFDQCPNDATKILPGICGCSVADTDTDGDGTADCQDQCVHDSSKISPGICGCGVPDVDSDEDDVPNCLDQCPIDSIKTEPGSCGCSIVDVDTDSDSTPDCLDACPSDATKSAPGLCGCGTSDTDTDQDGIPDCNDQCVHDSTKTTSGICGCGVPDTDSDGDGTADCQDQCVQDSSKTSPGICGCGVPDVEYKIDGEVTELSNNFNLQCSSLDKLMRKLAKGSCGYGQQISEIRRAMQRACRSGKVEIKSIPTIVGNCYQECTLCKNEVSKDNITRLSKRLYTLSAKAAALEAECTHKGICRRSAAECERSNAKRLGAAKELREKVNEVYKNAVNSVNKIPSTTNSCTGK